MYSISSNLEPFRKAFGEIQNHELFNIDEIRKWKTKAYENFESRGFPSIRNEAWRETNLTSVAQTHWQTAKTDRTLVKRESLDPYFLMAKDSPCLVFANGIFEPSLTSFSKETLGLRISPLSDALREPSPLLREWLSNRQGNHDPLSDLNAALFTDGAYIELEKNAFVEKPIFLIHFSHASEESILNNVRNLIFLGSNSKCTIVEMYVGEHTNPYLMNAETEIVTEENAHLHHIRVQNDDKTSFHLGRVQIHQKQNSSFTNFNITLGSIQSRVDINVGLSGEGSSCALLGLYSSKDSQHFDHQTFIQHAKPNCTSEEIYKGLLDHDSRTNFNGKIRVEAKAQKTSSVQSNKNLLLSERATASSNPQLEILADDVKCSHGSTVGQMDQTSLFYLQSRGISKSDAQRILTFAFLNDVLMRIPVSETRSWIENELFGLEFTHEVTGI